MALKAYHILVIISSVWFIQQQTGLSNIFSKNGQILGKILSTDINGELDFIANGRSIINPLFALASSKDSSKLNSITIKDISQKLLNDIEKYPKAAGTIGLGISVYLVHDSFSDNAEVRRIKKEYEDLLNTKEDIFKSRDLYLQHIFKRTNQIRNQVIHFKSEQKYKTIWKTITAFVFGLIGYSTSNPTLKPMAYASAGITGVGAIINGYNWGELQALVNRLEKTGYIV